MDTPTQIDDGGPAFPAQDNCNSRYPGMTLRDWFAGQALAGICAHMGPIDCIPDTKLAYRVADAMIAARKCSSTSGQ